MYVILKIFHRGIMFGGIISHKIFSQIFLLGFLLLFIGITNGCSDNSTKTEIEERDGLLFIRGEDDLFTGKIVDTISTKIISYKVDKGKKNGEFKISTVEGKVEMKGTIKDNLNEGLWTYYYPNGQIESIGNFSENLSEGKWVWYFENGKIREIGYFKAGKKNGEWTIYDQKGNIKRKLHFENDRIVYDHQFDKELFS
jgi:antitoxin component YwqK of YwqJK toxin-antitoxin module